MFAMSGMLAAQMDRIHGSRIRPHVKFLSSDLLTGRAPGTPGGQLAAAYLAAQFEAAGLKPAGDKGTYYQQVPLKLTDVLPGATLSASAGSKSVSFRWEDDFVGRPNTQEERVPINAPAVFVGHGIVAPEFQWNDYEGVEAKGKVVVLFTGEPPSEDPAFFGGKALTYYGRWTYKYEEATRQGALGVIIVHTAPTASYGWPVVKGNARPSPQVARQPGVHALSFAGWVTTEAGNQIFGLSGKTVDEMLKLADTKGFRAVALDAKVQADLRMKVTPIEPQNVVAMVEGSDPRLKNEAVVFSAHWDHLGQGSPVNGDTIYNGAIDNATGCAMLVEMARAWASMEPKPRRSALFVAVTAEESGLIGSQYFAEKPPIPAASIAANLNFDSYAPFGRVLDAVMTGAEKTSFFPTVQNALKRFNLELKPDPRPEAGSYFRSDHFPFAKVGIPAFSVNMGGTFEGKPTDFGAERRKEYAAKYHQPADEYSDKWDFAGMEQFARFGFALGLDIANLERIPERLKF
jgi:Zn-dependent M28 family amino/carboxypeptidase